MRVLARTVVERLIEMPEAVGLMRELFGQIGRGEVNWPDRTVLELNGGQDSILFMPGHLRGSRAVGLKVVSVFPGNPRDRRRPTVSGVIVLNDPDDGSVMALMDAAHLTALRTGAVSGLATDLLARADCRILSVFGAGVQARNQIDAVLHVRPIERVLIYAPSRARAARLADEVNARYGTGCRAEPAGSADAAAAAADIIVTATTSNDPVFDGTRLEPGVHINAVGGFKPAARELDDVTMKRARVFVDERASALSEAGDLIVPIERGILALSDVRADLAELVLDPARGRKGVDDITVFKSVGLAAEDIAIANRVLIKAVAAGAGVVIDGFHGGDAFDLVNPAASGKSVRQSGEQPAL